MVTLTGWNIELMHGIHNIAPYSCTMLNRFIEEPALPCLQRRDALAYNVEFPPYDG